MRVTWPYPGTERLRDTRTMTIQSFSGTHPFRPQCLIGAIKSTMSADEFVDQYDQTVEEHVARLVLDIVAGVCPRCFGTLRRNGPKEILFGSKFTPCQCIPICSQCAEHEYLLLRLVGLDPREAASWELDTFTYVCAPYFFPVASGSRWFKRHSTKAKLKRVVAEVRSMERREQVIEEDVRVGG